LTAQARSDADVVVYSGPFHVLEYVGDNILELVGWGPLDCLPVLDRVYRTGVSEDVHGAHGRFHVVALREEGRIVGVGSILVSRPIPPAIEADLDQLNELARGVLV
jgi:hypothetical protein